LSESQHGGDIPRNDDLEHLRLLGISHYIIGGVAALFALFPLIHVGLGIWMLTTSEALQNHQQGEPPVELFGDLFAALGLLFMLGGEVMAGLTLYSGRQIQRREKYLFSFVIACAMGLFIRFGTILGVFTIRVFTIIVLSRESVQQLYGRPT